MVLEVLMATIILGKSNVNYEFSPAPSANDLVVAEERTNQNLLNDNTDQSKVGVQTTIGEIEPSPQLQSDNSVEIIGTSNLSCVPYFKQRSGVTRSLGYAGNTPSQGNIPKVGTGALWKKYGHIGYIVSVDDDVVTVEDANWIKGKITRHRLSIDNFRGYVYN